MTSDSGPRTLLKAPPPSAVPGWAPAALLALGLATGVLLLLGDAARERQLSRDVAALRAAAEIESGVADSRARMERYAAGDAGTGPREVWDGIERSLALARGLGGEGAALENDLRAFAGLSLRRQGGFEKGEAAGPGSPLAAAYDAGFQRLAADAARLRGAAERRLASRQAVWRLGSRALLAGWLAVLAASFLGFRRFEARRRRSEAALRERDLQLVQAQKMEAVGRLAGGLAHDVNNYLAAIRSQCELIRRKPEPPERVAERAEGAIESVERAATLIGRLLAFSRRQPIHPETLDLNGVVRGLEKILGQHLGERVELTQELAPDLRPVHMDRAQLEQVLVNLVVNAREAMPRGGRLRIATADVPLPESGPAVMLAVSDTGVGIPPEIQDRIFEPFFTTKEAKGNSGLGLATLYGIVRQHGGDVRVESEPGRGTTFRVYLPPTDAPAAAPAVAGGAPQPVSGGSERILLVEDDAQVRQSTAGLLESAGYDVTAVSGGAAALEAAEEAEDAEEPFDLLITDVVMPGLSGPETAERIRALGWLPVIFVSGYSESVIHVHGLLEPGVDFLAKPFAADALFRKVREVLDRKE